MYLKLSGILILLALGLTPALAQGTAAQPFAVIELFTSEGCSSCPPADQFARALAAESRDKGIPIYVVGFHVDYWNRLGWPDRFSASQFTKRQREYAVKLRTTSIYTPQVIINGQFGLSGNRRDEIKSQIDVALAAKPQVSVRITKGKVTAEKTSILYELSEVPKNSKIHLALVERNLSSNVLRGENAGKTLKHDNVVRSFNSRALNGLSGAVTIDHSKVTNSKNSSIIAYVQESDTFKILGAAQISL